MSWVFVVVIDCTLIGASPPTATSPTIIWRVFLRVARTGSSERMEGIPSAILTRSSIALREHGGECTRCEVKLEDRVNDIRNHEKHSHTNKSERHHVA